MLFNVFVETLVAAGNAVGALALGMFMNHLI
jgi:hypothetical protein